MTPIGTSKDWKHQRDLSWAVSEIAQLKNSVPQSRNAIDFPDSPVPRLPHVVPSLVATVKHTSWSWSSEVHVSNGRVRLPQGSQTHSTAYFSHLKCCFGPVSSRNRPYPAPREGHSRPLVLRIVPRAMFFPTPQLIFGLWCSKSVPKAMAVHLGATCGLGVRPLTLDIACIRRLLSRSYLS
jgi:hypothetical protein